MELAFLGCGGFLLVVALRNFYRGYASKNWPQTQVPSPGRTYWFTAAMTARGTRRNWNTSTRIK
ncbi:MAG: hypothetical protein ABSH09_11130, partial [Bryobacteraceae bacterium]